MILKGSSSFDGGISANAPLAAAIALGAERLVVFPTGFPCAVRAVPQGLSATVLHTFALLVARQLLADIPRAREQVALRIVPPLCPLTVASHDFTQSRQLMATAEKQTHDWIAGGGLESDETPMTLLPHFHEIVP